MLRQISKRIRKRLQIEYMVVSLDDDNKNARLSLRQSEILQELASEEAESRKAASDTGYVNSEE